VTRLSAVSHSRSLSLSACWSSLQTAPEPVAAHHYSQQHHRPGSSVPTDSVCVCALLPRHNDRGGHCGRWPVTLRLFVSENSADVEDLLCQEPMPIVVNQMLFRSTLMVMVFSMLTAQISVRLSGSRVIQSEQSVISSSHASLADYIRHAPNNALLPSLCLRLMILLETWYVQWDTLSTLEKYM